MWDGLYNKLCHHGNLLPSYNMKLPVCSVFKSSVSLSIAWMLCCGVNDGCLLVNWLDSVNTSSVRYFHIPVLTSPGSRLTTVKPSCFRSFARTVVSASQIHSVHILHTVTGQTGLTGLNDSHAKVPMNCHTSLCCWSQTQYDCASKACQTHKNYSAQEGNRSLQHW